MDHDNNELLLLLEALWESAYKTLAVALQLFLCNLLMHVFSCCLCLCVYASGDKLFYSMWRLLSPSPFPLCVLPFCYLFNMHAHGYLHTCTCASCLAFPLCPAATPCLCMLLQAAPACLHTHEASGGGGSGGWSGLGTGQGLNTPVRGGWWMDGLQSGERCPHPTASLSSLSPLTAHTRLFCLYICLHAFLPTSPTCHFLPSPLWLA